MYALISEDVDGRERRITGWIEGFIPAKDREIRLFNRQWKTRLLLSSRPYPIAKFTTLQLSLANFGILSIDNRIVVTSLNTMPIEKPKAMRYTETEALCSRIRLFASSIKCLFLLLVFSFPHIDSLLVLFFALSNEFEY